jgi:uncharacterized membrane protein YqiK
MNAHQSVKTNDKTVRQEAKQARKKEKEERKAEKKERKAERAEQRKATIEEKAGAVRGDDWPSPKVTKSPWIAFSNALINPKLQVIRRRTWCRQVP